MICLEDRYRRNRGHVRRFLCCRIISTER